MSVSKISDRGIPSSRSNAKWHRCSRVVLDLDDAHFLSPKIPQVEENSHGEILMLIADKRRKSSANETTNKVESGML